MPHKSIDIYSVWLHIIFFCYLLCSLGVTSVQDTFSTVCGLDKIEMDMSRRKCLSQLIDLKDGLQKRSECGSDGLQTRFRSCGSDGLQKGQITWVRWVTKRSNCVGQNLDGYEKVRS